MATLLIWLAWAVLATALTLGAFRALNWLSRKRDHTSRADVATILEGFLDGTLSADAWEDFMALPLANSDLNAIARHCGRLPEDFPPDVEGHYCGPGGMEVIRGYIRQLRSEDGAARGAEQ